MTDQASTMRHNQNKVDETHAANHIVSARTYLIVFIALLILTALTVAVAYYNFGGLWNLVIALGIATVKAVVVALWFMHVRFSGRLVQLTIITSLMFLSLLIFGTLMDVWTRHNVTPAEHLENFEYNKVPFGVDMGGTPEPGSTGAAPADTAAGANPEAAAAAAAVAHE